MCASPMFVSLLPRHCAFKKGQQYAFALTRYVLGVTPGAPQLSDIISFAKDIFS
jgi:hypothetical protein